MPKKEKQELRLTELELARLDLHDTRIRLQQTIVEKLKFKQAIVTTEYQKEMGAVKGKIAEANGSISEAQQDSNAQVNDIEKRLGIKLSEYTVADDGTLTKESDLG